MVESSGRSLIKLPELDSLSVRGYILKTNKNHFATIFIEYTAHKSDNVILYCHGNSCDIGLCLDSLLDLAFNLEVNVFCFEYPGYG